MTIYDLSSFSYFRLVTIVVHTISMELLIPFLVVFFYQPKFKKMYFNVYRWFFLTKKKLEHYFRKKFKCIQNGTRHNARTRISYFIEILLMTMVTD